MPRERDMYIYIDLRMQEVGMQEVVWTLASSQLSASDSTGSRNHACVYLKPVADEQVPAPDLSNSEPLSE